MWIKGFPGLFSIFFSLFSFTLFFLYLMYKIIKKRILCVFIKKSKIKERKFFLLSKTIIYIYFRLLYLLCSLPHLNNWSQRCGNYERNEKRKGLIKRIMKYTEKKCPQVTCSWSQFISVENWLKNFSILFIWFVVVKAWCLM